MSFVRLTTLYLMFALCASGCSTAIVPPIMTGESAAVYVANYGRHSSILLPDHDGRLSEFAFGDYNWFALGHITSGDAFHGLFFSAGAALGRRQLAPADDGYQAEKESGARVALRFEASRAKVDALRNRLNGEFDRRPGAAVFNPRPALWFIHSPQHYSWLNNCNQMTARWLRSLGCEIHGPAIFSSFTIHPRGT